MSGPSLRTLELPPAKVLEPRFHVITGKGGVGKSTIALTLGLVWAQKGLKTLICEVDDREMMTRAFEAEPSAAEVRELRPNLSVVSIDTQSALSEYGALKLKVRALAKLLTDNPLTQALISVVPGVGDLIALGKAFNHEREVDQHGQPIWDRIIVDAPSTGHGLTFLRLPQVIREVVPSGNMRREADEMWSLLTDTQRTVIHVVTIPEELPVQETLELYQALDRELGLNPQCLWINKIEQSPFSSDRWEEVQPYFDQSSPSTLIRTLNRRQQRATEQLDAMSDLKRVSNIYATLPRFPERGPVSLKESIAYALEAYRGS